MASSTLESGRMLTSTSGVADCDASLNMIATYYQAKDIVLRAGFGDEVLWQSSILFDNITESDFLREHAWVTLSAGMKERVIRQKFQDISSSFYDWESAGIIVDHEFRCRQLALMHFNNSRKIEAIIHMSHSINSLGFNAFKKSLRCDPLELLQSLPYIGPVTCYHLAKNIGLPVAKPDRHLTRLADSFGYDDVQMFCEFISNHTGDSIPVVDIVLWRFAVITPGYLEFFRKGVRQYIAINRDDRLSQCITPVFV
jgi:hypothetical protein